MKFSQVWEGSVLLVRVLESVRMLRMPVRQVLITLANRLQYPGIAISSYGQVRWSLGDPPLLVPYAGGIAKKVEEASVIAALGVEVAIAQAGSDAGRLACLRHPRQLGGHSGWEGTCLRLQR